MKYLLALLAALPLSALATSSPLLPPRVERVLQQRVDDGQYPALVMVVVNGERSQAYAFGKLTNGKRRI